MVLHSSEPSLGNYDCAAQERPVCYREGPAVPGPSCIVEQFGVPVLQNLLEVMQSNRKMLLKAQV